MPCRCTPGLSASSHIRSLPVHQKHGAWCTCHPETLILRDISLEQTLELAYLGNEHSHSYTDCNFKKVNLNFMLSPMDRVRSLPLGEPTEPSMWLELYFVTWNPETVKVVLKRSYTTKGSSLNLYFFLLNLCYLQRTFSWVPCWKNSGT